MTENERKTTVWLRQKENYQFEVTTDFPEDWSALADEPPHLGKGQGASASRFLAAGLGHCLAASLLFLPGKIPRPAGWQYLRRSQADHPPQ